MDTLKAILTFLETKPAEQIQVIDMRGVCSYTDYFVIVTAKNPRHLLSLLNDCEKELDRLGQGYHREGENGSSWLLLDAKDFMIHFFLEESRRQYRLEALWADQPQYRMEEMLVK
ncbi:MULTISPECIES: ribosome silencing factor [Terrabacteria group]|uniref:ribosome silencing factor n=1 Tax=Bacillati TaxID=1783272 RepID=UPI001939EA6A|nr:MULTISPECIES: ribosome silencing factor [Terrabacteria group]MBW9212089.1 ribosome silencing factor [Trueperella sp. zg.1013]QRG87105.1 ribosome silencing factor [Bulleidia sp. zg-1006]